MTLPALKDRGTSLMELLIVLAVVSILAMAGVGMLGNRQGGAVRSLLDELEGALAISHSATAATGRDMAVASWGSWSAPPLVIAQGDADLTDPVLQTQATALLATGVVDATVARSQTIAAPFHLQPGDATHSRAKVVEVGSNAWSIAMMPLASGAVNQDFTAVAPFNTGGAMVGQISDANNFFKGTSAPNRITISGSSKRFNNTLVIQVVGTSRSGGVLPGSPMGLLVVSGNGATIYKFYNPGVLSGNGKWRRI